VICRLSSEARKTTACAMSSSVVNLRRAISPTYSSRTSVGVQPRTRAFSSMIVVIRFPSTTPGQITFTLMP
jgi:hypothetical protein